MGKLELNQIYNMDCVEGMKLLDDEVIDLTISSPPYGDLRLYNGFSFDFKGTAKQLFRVTKPGGVVVWIIGDETINGSESGESFRQALFFKEECGFNLHDTMIYKKNSCPNPSSNRYYQIFEYMFVFSKGKPKTFNPIKDRPNKWINHDWKQLRTRKKDGSYKTKTDIKPIKPYGVRFNIWKCNTGFNHSATDAIARKHPAIAPEPLVGEHIISWSEPGDLILDMMCGSGTTCYMAKLHGRNYIGFDISEDYCKIARERISNASSLNDPSYSRFLNM
jgi:site-specific DNA-methyltransferase (adenine-specific)